MFGSAVAAGCAARGLAVLYGSSCAARPPAFCVGSLRLHSACGPSVRPSVSLLAGSPPRALLPSRRPCFVLAHGSGVCVCVPGHAGRPGGFVSLRTALGSGGVHTRHSARRHRACGHRHRCFGRPTPGIRACPRVRGTGGVHRTRVAPRSPIVTRVAPRSPVASFRLWVWSGSARWVRIACHKARVPKSQLSTPHHGSNRMGGWSTPQTTDGWRPPPLPPALSTRSARAAVGTGLGRPSAHRQGCGAPTRSKHTGRSGPFPLETDTTDRGHSCGRPSGLCV